MMIKAIKAVFVSLRRPRPRRYFYLDKTYLMEAPVMCPAERFERILNSAKCYEFYNDPTKGIIYICEKKPQDSIFGLAWNEFEV